MQGHLSGEGNKLLKQTIGIKILGICLLVVSVFTVLNVYSYQKSQQVTIGYRDVIERNAALIFKVYAADIELSRQAALLQQYLTSGNDQHRQEFEESKVNMAEDYRRRQPDHPSAQGLVRAYWMDQFANWMAPTNSNLKLEPSSQQP